MKILKTLMASAFLACCLSAGAQETIEIGLLTTTHVIFTSDLTYVDISSKDQIVAKVVEASKNMLAIKARQEFAFKTTVSALEANGTMHTFYVKYNPNPSILIYDTRVGGQSGAQVVNAQIRPDAQQPPVQQQGGRAQGDRQAAQQPAPSQPASGVTVSTAQTSNFGRANAPTLEEVMRKGREIYHITDKSYKLEANVVNIYAYSDLTYIVIEIFNNSDIGYEAGDAQFTVESRRSSKQLTTDKSIWPKSSYGTLSCAPNSKTMVGYTVPKLTLQKNEMLKIYIYEKDGTRNLFLTLSDKDVNYAVSPVSN